MAGYRVGTAATGGEALDRVGRERPDLVILDVMLPDLDGFTVCRCLVAADENHPPVLFLTARDSLDSPVTACRRSDSCGIELDDIVSTRTSSSGEPGWIRAGRRAR
ncbi:response regulator [Streptomyces violaceusniger]|uniref:response regulator n=1 Tax=Streptomyces violaceusniger TaxID=68280 RepID=UPI0020740D51|nr:response regulator [Streptomyces violaceusniger]